VESLAWCHRIVGGDVGAIIPSHAANSPDRTDLRLVVAESRAEQAGERGARYFRVPL